MKIIKKDPKMMGLTLELDQHEVLCVMASLMVAKTMLGDDPEGIFAEKLGKQIMGAAISEQMVEVGWGEMFKLYSETLNPAKPGKN